MLCSWLFGRLRFIPKGEKGNEKPGQLPGLLIGMLVSQQLALAISNRLAGAVRTGHDKAAFDRGHGNRNRLPP